MDMVLSKTINRVGRKKKLAETVKFGIDRPKNL